MTISISFFCFSHVRMIKYSTLWQGDTENGFVRSYVNCFPIKLIQNPNSKPFRFLKKCLCSTDIYI